MNTPDKVPPQESAQQRFDKVYVSTTEICRELQVTRASVLQARNRGQLPDAVHVGGNEICVWEREAVRPYLEGWRKVLAAKRTGVTTA